MNLIINLTRTVFDKLNDIGAWVLMLPLSSIPTPGAMQSPGYPGVYVNYFG